MNINYGKQNIDKDDIQKVIKALKSEKITQGKFVEIFEKYLKKKFKAKHCIAVSNGTSALYLSIKSLNLKRSSKIVCSTNTFFSSIYTVIMNKLEPSLCDIENQTYNIDLNKLEDKIKRDKKIRAVIAVDFAGHPCDWESLNFLKKKYKLYMINDNCHAIGASIKNNQGYAVKYADLVTHSYHPVKNITTGEGGSVLTNNDKLSDKIIKLRNHGISRNKIVQSSGSWLYEVKNFGFNFRLSDIHSALGISQLKKLDKFIINRNKIAKHYNLNFNGLPFLNVPKVKTGFTHAFHLYPLLIDFKKLNVKKNLFFDKMKRSGINLQVHYIPVYHQKFLTKYRFNKKLFPIMEDYYSRQVSLPIYYLLKKDKIEYVVNQVKKALNVK